MITAWYRPGKGIYNKLTGSNIGYKHAPLGIAAVDKLQFAVFPNPAQNHLIIQGVAVATYTISNLTGQVLLSGKLSTNKKPIDIHQLSPGMYWIQVQADGQMQHLKFIKL